MRASHLAWLSVLFLPMPAVGEAVWAEDGSGTSGEDERSRFSSGYEAYQHNRWFSDEKITKICCTIFCTLQLTRDSL